MHNSHNLNFINMLDYFPALLSLCTRTAETREISPIGDDETSRYFCRSHFADYHNLSYCMKQYQLRTNLKSLT